MSWRAGLFLLLGIPALLAFGDALVGGLSFAMFSYPLAMLSIWQHGRRISRYTFDAAVEASAADRQLVGIARKLDGASSPTQNVSDVRYISQAAYDAGLNAKRRRPTIIEGIALAAALLMIGSLTLSLILPAISSSMQRTPAAKRSSTGTSPVHLDAAKGSQLDVTSRIRAEARTMAKLLVQCGLEPEEAYRIALHKMPGQTLLNWWDSDILRPFSSEHRSLLKQQLAVYLDAARNRSDNQTKAEFIEGVIVAAVQKDKMLSDTEAFALWQAGLSTQSEAQWNRIIGDLADSRQKQLNNFRREMFALSRSSEPVPIESQDAQFGYEVWKRRRDLSVQAIDKERGIGSGSTTASPLAQSNPRRITGKELKYTLDLPEGWAVQPTEGDYDILVSNSNGRLGIITEEIAFESTEAMISAVQKHVRESNPAAEFTRAAETSIDSHKWSYFYAFMTVEGIPITYRFCVYSGKEGSTQIVMWTARNVFSRYQPSFDQIMGSFRFPKVEK